MAQILTTQYQIDSTNRNSGILLIRSYVERDYQCGCCKKTKENLIFEVNGVVTFRFTYLDITEKRQQCCPFSCYPCQQCDFCLFNCKLCGCFNYEEEIIYFSIHSGFVGYHIKVKDGVEVEIKINVESNTGAYFYNNMLAGRMLSHPNILKSTYCPCQVLPDAILSIISVNDSISNQKYAYDHAKIYEKACNFMCCCKERMFTLESNGVPREIINNSADSCLDICLNGKTFGNFELQIPDTSENELIKLVTLLASHYFKSNFVYSSFPP